MPGRARKPRQNASVVSRRARQLCDLGVAGIIAGLIAFPLVPGL
jgi:hypothetical protein